MEKDKLCVVQGGSNMTGTDLCVNKPHCAAAVRPWESEATTSTLHLHSLKVAQLLRSAACLHTNHSRSYLNDLVDCVLHIVCCILCVTDCVSHVVCSRLCVAFSFSMMLSINVFDCIGHKLSNKFSTAEFWKQNPFSLSTYLNTRNYIRIDTVCWMLKLCGILKEDIKAMRIPYLQYFCVRKSAHSHYHKGFCLFCLYY